MPHKFSLAVRGARPRHLEMAGTCFRLVLSELALATVYGDEDLSWAPPLTTAAMCRVLQFRSLAVYYTWTRLRDEAREHALVLLREHHHLRYRQRPS